MERTTATPHSNGPQRTASNHRRPATAADSVLALQANAGNHAVTRALAARTLARCSGPCTCGGKCGQEQLLEDELRPKAR